MDPVLLYDGNCGLCSSAVRFVLRRDRTKRLRFASLDGEFARTIRSLQQMRELDTLVWYEPAGKGGTERLMMRSAAVLRVLGYLGGPWKLGLLLTVLPRPFLDFLYRLVARHRHRLSGCAGVCLVPPPADRHRFLD